LIYTFTNWLSFADYALPDWLAWAGVLIMALSLLLFWRSHYDLKANWSSSVELYEGHTLITNGIYRHMRHPMYASQFVEGLAQLLLLQNWIAGPIGLLAFILFYLLRSRAEEQMMLAKFGDQYRVYMKTTGTIFPKF
jgi:protein-S-isoprenylcysteine O-methyltransferase Ste14